MGKIFDEYMKQKPVFIDTLRNYLDFSEIKTVFEIGSCECEDSIKLSRAFKNATIYGFEALPKNVALAKQHITDYKADRIILNNLALSNKSGKAVFYVSSGRPEDAPTDPDWDFGNKSSSLLKPDQDNGLYEWLDFKEKITVSTERIDTFCQNNGVKDIDFLHMDVQGAEIMVMEGAGDLLSNVKAVWLEVEAKQLYKGQPLEADVETFMLSRGFTCVLSTVSTVTGDKLYINNKLLEAMWLSSVVARKRSSAERRKTEVALRTNQPRVTVLMSAYNSQDYLHEAIDSILNQSFTNFELLIINDGSKDRTLKIINGYQDARIRIVSRENWGLTASLNQGVELAKGEFIARQDADDISILKRLEKEVKFLDDNPKIGMVGSNYTIMDEGGKKLVTTNVFTNPNDLKITQVTCNQYGHGSVMMRTAIARKLGGYDKKVGYVEDYDLWTRISRVSSIANFEEPLYLYRRNDAGVTRQNLELQIQQTFAVRDKAFQHYLKNRSSYKPFGYHPSGHHYRDRKATLYRDLAFLFRQSGRRWGATRMLIAAILYQPKNKRNYRLVAKTLLKPKSPNWEYEFL